MIIEPTRDTRMIEHGTEEADAAIRSISEGFCPEHLIRLTRPVPEGRGFPTRSGYCKKCDACYATHEKRDRSKDPGKLWVPDSVEKREAD